ncbi:MULTISPECIES: hypothetical protein [unclassified Streptomyces]|uniref:hypothetical protein n=1 Tax=unclassified Streptomyces TaxID=2593676 RepID=UPI00037C523D|nr:MULTISPECIES: hypothetical protein [unclassified Streptomyces]MYT31701.1 hypothetical protein [Streptomyces sp. SID8354]
MAGPRYLVHTVPETEEYLDDIANDMVTRFRIPLAEAVARINRHWEGKTFDSEDDLIFHEMPEFWADLLYYGAEVPYWDPDADRSKWNPIPAPPADSSAWTL